MADVVGLRFVTEGQKEALASLELYERGLRSLSHVQDRHVAEMNRARQMELRAFEHNQRLKERSLRQEAAAQAAAARAVEQAAAERQRAMMRDVQAFQQAQQLKERTLQREAAAQAAVARETQALARAYNPVMAAAATYTTRVEELNRAHQLGVLTADAFQAQMVQLQAAYGAIGQDTARAAAFVNNFTAANTFASRGMNSTGMALQQTGYQVGDFLVQVQSGTNAFVAFGQQATQLVGILPMFGSVLGISGTALVGLSAGLGIAIPLLTALGAMWSRTRDTTDSATDAIKSYEDALESMRRQSMSTRDELAALFAGFEGAGEGAIINAIRDREAEIESLRQLAQAQIEAFTGPRADILGASPEMLASNPLLAQMQQAALRELADLQRQVNAELESEIALREEATRADQERLEANRRIREELARATAVGRSIEDREQENQLLEVQLTYMQQGVELSEARARAEEDLLLRQAMVIASAENATAEQQAFVDRLVEAINKGRELKNSMDALAAVDVSAGVAAAASSAAQLARELNVSLRAASALMALGRSDEVVFDPRDPRFNQTRATMARLRMEAGTVSPFDPSRQPRDAGGGGGGTSQLVTLEAIAAEMERRIERERVLLGLTDEQRRAQEIMFTIQDRLVQAGVNYTEGEIAGVAARIAAREQELQQMETMRENMDRLSQTIENSFASAFTSIVDGTKSAGDAFKDMARAIIAELFRVLVVQQLVGQIRGAIGGLGGIGLVPNPGAISLNANGNAFAGGTIIPFANGGVVGAPTLFPMSGGRTGLMGEAGPEAIMPLKRGRDGKLGVAAEGGQTIHQTINFNVAANGDDSVRRIIAQAAPDIVEAAKNGVLDARRRGGAFRSTFR